MYTHTINTCNEKKNTMNLLPTVHSFHFVAVQSKAKMNSVMIQSHMRGHARSEMEQSLSRAWELHL